MSASAPQSDELLWQALQYLSGELSASEVAEFEARLAEDCDLCEALSRAVVLSQAVIACERDSQRAPAVGAPAAALRGSTSVPSRRWSRALVAGGAALLAVVAIWGWQVRNGAQVGPGLMGGGELASNQSSQDSAGSDPVLALWVSLGTERDADDSEPVWDPSRDAAADDSDADVPGWMIAALLTSSDARRLDVEGDSLDPVQRPQQEEPL